MNAKQKIILSLFIFGVIVALFFIIKDFKKKPNDIAFLPHILENSGDLKTLVDKMSEMQFVLLGEASHGTSEYYKWRSAITKELIQQKAFSFIAVEGDWADLYKVNKYVKHFPTTYTNGREILTTFTRWPTWMWANEEFLELVEWLREHNQNLPPEQRVGIYGKDLYGINDSIKEVVSYLKKVDPGLANEAEVDYGCLLEYQNNFNIYLSDFLSRGKSCANEVTDIVQKIRAKAEVYRTKEEKDYFNAKQNALVIKHGEDYYRSSVVQGPGGWNSRAMYMDQTVNRLKDFYGPGAKGIIWAHNTHVGDARATEMEKVGMVNIGQLLRENYGEDQIYIVGFGTYEGTVIAGQTWGADMKILKVPPAAPNSVEALLNQAKYPSFIVFLNELTTQKAFAEMRGNRAKGVVYNPENEKGNYVQTRLSKRYDAFIFIKKTTALTPI